MDLTSQLFAVAETYAEATGASLATVSTQAGDSGTFFRRVREGRTLTIRRYERVMVWFSTHWPEGTPWPAEVPRPSLEIAA